MTAHEEIVTGPNPIVELFRIATRELDTPPIVNEKLVAAARARGIDPVFWLVTFHSLSAEINFTRSLSFYLECRVGLRVNERLNGIGDPIEARVTWASGGGEPVRAVAEASLYLDLAHRLARVRIAAEHVVNKLSTPRLAGSLEQAHLEQKEAFAALRASLEESS